MVPVKDFNRECGEIKLRQEIKHRGDTVKVYIDKFDVNLYCFLLSINWRAPKGFKWIHKLLKVVPLRIFKRELDKKILVTVQFTRPVEFCSLKHKNEETFRLISFKPNYAVNKEGKLLNVNTENLINPNNVDNKGYRIYASGSIVKQPVHRLVAWAWVENDDYVKNYVVDHIDEDKANCHADNLRWVTQRLNVSRSHPTNPDKADKRWMVYDPEEGGLTAFTSLKEIEEWYGVPYKNLFHYTVGKSIKLKNGKYIALVDWENKEYRKNFKKAIEIVDRGGAKYEVRDKEGNINYYNRIIDILEDHGLTEYDLDKMKDSGLKTYFVRLQKLLKDKGYELIDTEPDKKVYNQHSDDKYHIEAKNLKTGEVISASSTRLLGEKLGVHKGKIIERLNGNKLHGLPLVDSEGNEWLIRKSNMAWPIVRKSKKKPMKKIMYKPTGEIFESIREASRRTNKTRYEIMKSLAGNPNWSDWKLVA